ncbi:MAG: SEC-C domain-containing protein [Rhizobiales bacterium]|nr:SEC-C domain-containing protein [Hyphomicrobiales bacterium]
MERERLGYIEDVLDELSRFTAASAHGENTASWEDDDWLLDEFNVHEPYRNPFKDVGRNDPCPCGSGAKFKKCCGG